MLRVSTDGPDPGPEPGDVLGPVTRTAPAEPLDFAQYVARQLPSLLRLGYALTGNPHDANDLVQDVLERVGVRWNSIIGRQGSPDGYVRRAMVNARVSRWRRRRRETLVAEIAESALPATPAPDGLFRDEPLWQALRALPVQQRTVLVLRYFEDLSETEIADTMGISNGAVKSHASRGMAALRRRLGAQTTTDAGGAS